jgi:hypothetical protein
MSKKRGLGRAPEMAIVASIALTVAMMDVHSSLAGCGGYCEAQQARAFCHRAIAIQGLKERRRDVEFEKCKADPMRYLEALTDGAEDSLD